MDWRHIKLFMFDASNADRSCNHLYAEMATKILESFGGCTSLLSRVMSDLTEEVRAKSRSGISFRVSQMLATGAPWTTYINTVTILMKAVFALREMHLWNDTCCLFQTGDDSIGVADFCYKNGWVPTFVEYLKVGLGMAVECHINNIAEVDYIGCKMVPALYNGEIAYVPIPMRFLKMGCFHSLELRDSRLHIVRASFEFWEVITRCDPVSHAWASFVLSRLPSAPAKGIPSSSPLKNPMFDKRNPLVDWQTPEVLEFYKALTPVKEAYDFAAQRYRLNINDITQFEHFLQNVPQASLGCRVDHPVLRAVIAKEHSL